MKKKLVTIMLATVTTIALVGCGSSSDSASSASSTKEDTSAATSVAASSNAATAETKDAGDITICYSIKGKNAWLEQQALGCQDACKELGIAEPTVVYNEDQTDGAAQSRSIEDMIALGPDVIIVDPSQPTVVSKVLEDAADAGIIIIETNTCGGLDMVSASVGLDEYSAAYEQGETLCSQLKEGDSVVIIAGAEGDTGGEARLEGQTAACEDNGIKVLDSQYTDWSADKAASVMEDMITRFSGEFQGVLTPSDDMAVAAINALEQAGVIDDVKVAGYGGFQIGCDAIKEGTMYMTVGMRPYQCGYQAVQIAYNILTENKYPDEEFTDVGVEMLTAENVDSWEGF